MPGSEPAGNCRPVSRARNTNPATVKVTGCANGAGAVSLDERAIHRIVAAGGPGRAQTIDVDGLRTNLHQGWDACQAAENSRRRDARVGRSKHAATIARLSAELLTCLDDAEHTELIQVLSLYFPSCEGEPVPDANLENCPGGVPLCDPQDPFERHQEPSFNGLKAGLRRTQYAAEMERARASRKPKSEVTPLMWLIGHELVNIYKCYIPCSSPKKGGVAVLVDLLGPRPTARSSSLLLRSSSSLGKRCHLTRLTLRSGAFARSSAAAVALYWYEFVRTQLDFAPTFAAVLGSLDT